MEMQMEYIRKLPEPQELMEQFPMDDGSKAVKRRRDEVIRNILAGKDDRFLLIIGPCSADNEKAVLDYIHRLVKVQDQVKDKIFIIPRVYTSKPRTIGVGYKGMLHQPDPEGQEDMLGGIMAIRELNVRVVRKRALPVPKKSSIRKFSATYRTFCPMLPLAPAPWKTRFTA